MSGRFVRSSKYRHVHGDQNRSDQCYHGIRPQCTGESNYIAGNTKFFAYSHTGGGGPVVVWNRDNVGRLPTGHPTVNTHKSKVLDLQFSPFNDNLLATGADDGLVNLTLIPEDGVKESIHKANITLTGHQKKVNLLNFHPTANNILASTSSDFTVKVWDIENETEAFSFAHEELVNSIQWNLDGSLMATTCKDHKVRIYDPRNDGAAQTTEGHPGGKPSKATWFSNHGLLGVLGFSKRATRVYNVYDPRKFDTPVFVGDIDQASGVAVPFYDPDTSVLYIGGKGDSNIKYYEVDSSSLHFLSEFRSTESQKGVTFLPKRAVDVTKCEIAIALRLMRDSVNPVHFMVPRKSDLFQEDIFPDSFAGVPSLDSDAWLKGENKAPVLASMKPGTDVGQKAAFVAKKSRVELEAELDTANKRIKELEAELAKLKA